jgi:RHS repeat-associated protein
LPTAQKHSLKCLTPTEKARIKFTGKEFDRDGEDAGGVGGIKLTYFGRRYYDPETGVWTSCDPSEQYFNPYSYVDGNPILVVSNSNNWSLQLS